MSEHNDGMGAAAFVVVVAAMVAAALGGGCVLIPALPVAQPAAAPVVTQAVPVVVAPVPDAPVVPDAPTVTPEPPAPVVSETPRAFDPGPPPTKWRTYKASDRQATCADAIPAPAVSDRVRLSAWVRPAAWGRQGSEKHGLTIVWKGVIGKHVDYCLSLQADGWLVYSSTKGGFGVCRPVVPLGAWTHVRCEIDESASTAHFWVNGVEAGPVEGFQGFPFRQYVDRWIEPSDAPLFVGSFFQNGWGYNDDDWIGDLADVKVEGF
jgi:hypothetical protein